MAFQYLTNSPLDKARDEYLAALSASGLSPKGEAVAVEQALGRLTFKAVYALRSTPHYNACAMDGIALNSQLTYGATETTPVKLSASQFMRVDTGDPLPQGCDCVVMIEDVIEIGGEGVELAVAAVPWQHVRQIGEDISAGDMILPSYQVITPAVQGALLACGVRRISAVRKPLIGIITTGDEIVPSETEEPAEGEIIEFNSKIFAGMLAQWGAAAKSYPTVKDNAEDIKLALEKALEECDAVILNAGSSAGREDYSHSVIKSVGTVLYHGIAIRPGKPTILGYCGEKPIIGVPGYPVSGIIVMEQLVKPVIAAITGRRFEAAEVISAIAARTLTSSLKYREFIRVRLGYVNERMVAVPLESGAGVVSSFIKADGIIDVPQNSEGVRAGETVKVHLLRHESEIRDTVVVTGSHDPLIDELADILSLWKPGSLLASSHVGSMGGIMAIKRAEAHLGGIHLLDEASGEYNIPYLKRYLQGQDAVLIRCVQRVQGLIIKKGNPKGIKCFADIAQPGLSYVNRQKGAGTRILCDYLAAKENIDTEAVYGYLREEYTHTGVAAIIAAGSADTGLGIYSAAKLYDLDFIPICDEQYDFLFAKNALELDNVQQFIKALKSKEFAVRLERMGGYTITNPGELITWA